MSWRGECARLFSGALWAVYLFGQQTVTTPGGTVGKVPKYSGPATIVPSAIVETGGRVGIGVVTPLYPLHVVNTTTGVSGAYINTLLQAAVDPADNSSATYIGWQGQSYTRLGNTKNLSGTLFGGLSQVDHYGSGLLASAYGFQGKVSNQGAGTLTNAYGLWLQIQNAGGGAIGNAYGMRIGAPINRGTGTIRNSYGIYIDNPTVGANPYSIYSAGGVNYFAGSVGIGTATPVSPLTVSGTVQSLSGGFKFPDGTVQTTATLQGPPGPQGPAGTVTLPFAGTVATYYDWAFRVANTGTGGGAIQGIGSALGGGVEGIAGVGGCGGCFTGGGDNMHTGPGPGVRGIGGSFSNWFGGAEGGNFVGGNGGAIFKGAWGLYARGGSNPDGTSSEAAYLDGNVTVTGLLSKAGGSFQIDHPADPASKYLYHSLVESPDMMNIYNGNVTTDATGRAVVRMPEWFSALNRDFRYQLTVIGQFAQAIVATELANNEFAIQTDKPMVKVSWQVTGIRQDAWANAHRIPVEVEKSEREKGHYLHPELFGEPVSKSVLVVERPALAAEKQVSQERFRSAAGLPPQ